MTTERACPYEGLRRGMEQPRSTQLLLRQSERPSILGEVTVEAVLGENLLREGMGKVKGRPGKDVEIVMASLGCMAGDGLSGR